MTPAEAEDEVRWRVMGGESQTSVISALLTPNACSEDYNCVDMFVREAITKLIPPQLSIYMDELLRSHATAEDLIFRWITAYSEENVDEEQVIALFRLRQPHAIIMGTLERKYEMLPHLLQAFMSTIKASFFKALANHTELMGELGIFRSLWICSTDIPFSQTFADTVQHLWNMTAEQTQVLSVPAKKDAIEHVEHMIFRQVVEQLPADFSFRHAVVQTKLASLFQPIRHRTIVESGSKILEFAAHNYSLKHVLRQIDLEVTEEAAFDEVRFVAYSTFIVDRDLDLRSTNVSIVAPEVIVVGQVKWDLSGQAANVDEARQKKAKDGIEPGEDGQDGEDGHAGGSSGDLEITTNAIVNSKTWNVKLCGGQGGPGQDGGDGANGRDGMGKDFDEAFPPATKYLRRGALAADTALLGAGQRVLSVVKKGFVDEVVGGIRHIYNRSTHYITDQIFEAYIGTNGEIGGRGGRNGVGGEGGKSGTFSVMTPGYRELTHEATIREEPGPSGEDGTPGKAGSEGKAGADVVATCKGTKWNDFGTTSNNKKIILEWVHTYDKSVFYVSEKYKGPSSLCYLRVLSVDQLRRQQLSDAVAFRRNASDRYGHALAKATKAIDRRAIAAKYADIFAGIQLMQGGRLDQRYSEIEVVRVATRFEMLPPLRHKPRKQKRIRCHSNKDVQFIVNNFADFITREALWKYPLEHAAVKTLKQFVQSRAPEVRLQRKFVVSELRTLGISVERPIDEPTLLEQRHRNCFRYLARTPEICNELEELFDKQNVWDTISRAVLDIFLLRATATAFGEHVKKLDELQSLKLGGQPLSMRKAKFEAFLSFYDRALNGFELDATLKKDIIDDIFEGATDSELNTIAAAWAKEEAGLAKWNNNVVTKLKTFSAKYPKSDQAALKIPSAFISAIIELENFVYANIILATAIQMISQLLANDTLRVRNFMLSDPTASHSDWLQILENDSALEFFKIAFVNLGGKASAGRLLYAWTKKINLRVYADGSLAEDHCPQWQRVHHVELDDKAELHRLIFSDEQIRLFHCRTQFSELIAKNVADRGMGNLCETIDLSLRRKEWLEVCSQCNGAEAKHESVDNRDMDMAEQRMDVLMRFLNDSRLLRAHFELLVNEYPDCGWLFVGTLIAVFDVDGAYMDEEDMLFIVETCVQTCALGGAQPWYLAGVLLTNAQDQWLNEFLLMNMENSRHKQAGKQLRLCVENVRDLRLKILLARKLNTGKLSDDELFKILKLLDTANVGGLGLESVPLPAWRELLAESQDLQQLELDCKATKDEIDTKLSNRLMSWCMRIKEAFDIEQAREVMKLFVERNFDMQHRDKRKLAFDEETNLNIDYVGFSRLIHYICNKELESCCKFKPLKVLQVLCSIDRDNPAPEDLKQRLGLLPSEIDEIKEELKKFCLEGGRITIPRKDTKIVKENTIKTVFRLLRIRNHGEDVSKSDGSKSSKKRDAIIDDLETAFLERNSETSVEIENVAVAILDKLPMQARPQEVFAFISEKKPKDMPMDNLLVALLDETIFRARDFRLRNNQKVALLAALLSMQKKHDMRGLLQEVGTGEGKSLIITCLAVISVLRGEKVHIVSSSSALAKRDTEAGKPLGCDDIYTFFGIVADHICVENEHHRQVVYASSDIVYGDISSFQRDHLLDQFYRTKITGNQVCDTIIVDEVDSMVLDQGNNTLYLSHEIPDLEFLRPLFVRIWQLVCVMLEKENDASQEKIAEIVQQVRLDVLPSIPLNRLEELLGIDAETTIRLCEVLERDKVIDRNGVLLVDSPEKQSASWSSEFDSTYGFMFKRLWFYVRQVNERQQVHIPQHLYAFTLAHFDEFVENAINAHFMEEGTGYQVDVVPSEVVVNREPRIVIVDQSTGVDLPSTQWSNGFHQFLQLKHGLSLTPLSLKAVFISNVSYIRKYAHIFGFSGTLGAEAEQDQLRALYKVECLRIAPSLPKLFYEECSIVSTTEEEHVESMYHAIRQQIEVKRAVLVICESIKQVDTLSRKIRLMASERQRTNSTMNDFFGDKDIKLYRRDRDKFEFVEGKKKIPCGQIIFATNLAGRGADIKLEDDLISNGGLHVIVAFLPENIRVEEQAFGRVARCGEPGSAQLVVLSTDIYGQNNICELKMSRNASEAQRVQAITSFYERCISVQEECFKKFTDTFKGHQQNLKDKLLSERQKHLLQRDVLDQWARWLDANSNGANASFKWYNYIGDPDRDVREAEKFCAQLDAIMGVQPPTQPLNRLNWGILNMEQNKLDKALKDFQYVQEMFPFFAAEARYYKAAITIVKDKAQTLDDKTIAHLEAARRAFSARVYQCYIDHAIVDVRKTKRHSLIAVDRFSVQQKEIARMYEIIIDGIERLLGDHVSYDDLVKGPITEEVAYALFRELSSSTLEKTPIRPTRFSSFYNPEDVSDASLSGFGAAHALSPQVVRERLDRLRHKQPNGVIAEDVCAAFPLPIAEEFWDELERLRCLRDHGDHIFVNEKKCENLNSLLAKKILNTKLPDSKKTNLSNNRLWLHENVVNEFAECDRRLIFESFERKTIRDLMMIGVLIETKSAVFAPNPEAYRPIYEPNELVENFNCFGFIKESDFQAAGLPAEDVQSVMKALIDAGIFLRYLEKLYLAKQVNLYEAHIPRSYFVTVMNLLKHRCAYVLAFRDILASLNSDEQVRLSLPSREQTQCQFMDLISYGILERGNVDVKNLSLSALKRCLHGIQLRLNHEIRDEVVEQDSPGVPLEHIDSLVSQLTLDNYEQLFNTARKAYAKKEIRKSNAYDEITNNASIEHIVEVLQKRQSARSGHNNAVVKLVELTAEMDGAGLALLRTQCLYAAHGATRVMKIGNLELSFMTIVKMSGIGTFGVAQIVAGFAVLYAGPKFAQPISDALINEGISDMTFVIQRSLSGSPRSFHQYKLRNVACSVLFYAFGGYGESDDELTRMTKASNDATIASGATACAMMLNGTQLIGKLRRRSNFSQSTEWLLQNVSKSLVSSELGHNFQMKILEYIKGIVDKFRTMLVERIRLALLKDSTLLFAMKNALEKLGTEKGMEVVNRCCQAMFGGNLFELFGKLCDLFLAKYREKIHEIVQDVAQSREEKLKYVQNIQNSIIASTNLKQLEASLEMIAQSTGKSIHSQSAFTLREYKQSDQFDFDADEQSNFKEIGSQLIGRRPANTADIDKLFKDLNQKLGAQLDVTLEQRVVNPLIMLATTRLQTIVNATVAEIQSSAQYMKKPSTDALHSTNRRQYSKKEISDAELQRFEATLRRRVDMTCNSRVLAEMFVRGVHADMVATSALATLLNAVSEQPARVVLTNSKGETFESKKARPQADIRQICLDLGMKSGLGRAAQSGDEVVVHSWLYSELSVQMPELQELFPTPYLFRRAFAEAIRLDAHFQARLHTRWHAICIQNRHIPETQLQKIKNAQKLQQFLSFTLRQRNLSSASKERRFHESPSTTNEKKFAQAASAICDSMTRTLYEAGFVFTLKDTQTNWKLYLNYQLSSTTDDQAYSYMKAIVETQTSALKTAGCQAVILMRPHSSKAHTSILPDNSSITSTLRAAEDMSRENTISAFVFIVNGCRKCGQNYERKSFKKSRAFDSPTYSRLEMREIHSCIL